MARPIKETPVLRGKDADRFDQKRKEAFSNSVDESTRKRIRENYERLKAIAKPR